jgi:tetratricopeptide (TPR) repeat protein
MLNKVIRLENALDNAVSDEFHAYRVKFNKLFLSEEFASAYASTLKMMDAKGILPHEKLELARNLMILGYPEEALQCLNLVLVEEPQNIIAIEAKLQLLKNMDLQDQYSELLLECIKIYPGKDHFYGLLYKQYQQLGDIIAGKGVCRKQNEQCFHQERELKTTLCKTETLENPSN